MYSWVSFCSIELKSTLEIRDKKEPQTIHYHTVKGTIGIHAFEIKNNDAGNYFAGKRRKRLESGPQVFRAKRLMRLGPLCVGVITGRHRINFGKLRISWVVQPNRISVVR